MPTIQRVRRSRPAQSADVEITLSVRCSVSRGEVSEADLKDWIDTAIRDYHCFRAGHVGLAAEAAITLPSTVIA